MRLLLLSATLALCGCSSLDRHFFYPDSTLYQTPKRQGLAYEELRIPSSDGTELSAWFLPAVGEAKGTVVHLHGNAQNMSAHFSFTAWLPKAGFNLLVFDYRGYGQSAGTPSRDGLVADSIAAIRYVQARPELDPHRVILFGQSMGGAMAIAAAGSGKIEKPAGVAVDSAFASYADVAQHVLQQSKASGLLIGAAGFLVSERHAPEKLVGKISPTPLLILHTRDDRIVPYTHGERLFARAGQPKQLIPIDNGGHTSGLALHRKAVIPLLSETFTRWAADARR